MIDDKQAIDLLEHQARVHYALLEKERTNWELATHLGISQIEVAGAIHRLSNQNYIETRIQGKDKYFRLSPLGRASAPPPPTPAFDGPECNPRNNKDPKHFLAPNHPRIAGTKHFVGVAGKWKTDENGAVILGADTHYGRVYKALYEHPTLVSLLPDKTGIERPSVYNACSTLVKMGLIERMTIDSGAAYRVTLVPVVLNDGSLQQTPRASAPPKPAAVPVDDSGPATGKAAINADVDQAVSALIEEFGAPDVMMSVMVYVDERLSQLQQLQRVMERARV